MREGDLWYLWLPKLDLAQKIALLASNYYARFGTKPNLCLVNPAMLPEGTNGNGIELGGVTVMGDPLVSVNYFKLGIKE